jgi:hypothetical protein
MDKTINISVNKANRTNGYMLMINDIGVSGLSSGFGYTELYSFDVPIENVQRIIDELLTNQNSVEG